MSEQSVPIEEYVASLDETINKERVIIQAAREHLLRPNSDTVDRTSNLAGDQTSHIMRILAATLLDRLKPPTSQ